MNEVLTIRLRIKQIDNMEVAALAGLVGMGYAVSRFSQKPVARPALDTKSSQPKEAFTSINSGGKYRSGFTNQNEAFTNQNQQQLAPKSLLTSQSGSPQNLDLKYYTVGGTLIPSEPKPGPYGMPLDFATKMPTVSSFPKPVPLESQQAMVEMRSDGIEESSNYLNGDYVVSQLTGQQIPTTEFRHNNMVPFYGGRIKQNMTPDMNQSRLDSFTGAGSTQIAKREVEQMFDNANQPYLKYGGAGDDNKLSDFVQSRINDPRSRNGERPFEPIRVGTGVGEKFGMTGKGGFQQIEVNDIMRGAMKTTDELRVATDPKLSYKGIVVPGQHFITNASEGPGEIRKYKLANACLLPMVKL